MGRPGRFAAKRSLSILGDATSGSDPIVVNMRGEAAALAAAQMYFHGDPPLYVEVAGLFENTPKAFYSGSAEDWRRRILWWAAIIRLGGAELKQLLQLRLFHHLVTGWGAPNDGFATLAARRGLMTECIRAFERPCASAPVCWPFGSMVAGCWPVCCGYDEQVPTHFAFMPVGCRPVPTSHQAYRGS